MSPSEPPKDTGYRAPPEPYLLRLRAPNDASDDLRAAALVGGVVAVLFALIGGSLASTAGAAAAVPVSLALVAALGVVMGVTMWLRQARDAGPESLHAARGTLEIRHDEGSIRVFGVRALHVVRCEETGADGQERVRLVVESEDGATREVLPPTRRERAEKIRDELAPHLGVEAGEESGVEPR